MGSEALIVQISAIGTAEIGEPKVRFAPVDGSMAAGNTIFFCRIQCEVNIGLLRAGDTAAPQYGWLSTLQKDVGEVRGGWYE